MYMVAGPEMVNILFTTQRYIPSTNEFNLQKVLALAYRFGKLGRDLTISMTSYEHLSYTCRCILRSIRMMTGEGTKENFSFYDNRNHLIMHIMYWCLMNKQTLFFILLLIMFALLQ
jgi:hypothetical protein